MCGIAGIVSVPGGRGSADARLMASGLAHRGPDAEGVWADADTGVAFGHRRLAVIDLSEAGAQPMTSGSGRWTVTYNGEIYNHPKLRRELVASGVSFRGSSDTEVLLEAIERWGMEATLRRCDGMFAFAAWDAVTRTLTLARDRFGEKPLYYGRFGSTFLFASELRAMRVHPEFRAEPNLGAVRALIEYGYIPAPASIYAGVAKLEPGCLLEVASGGPVGPPRRWWDPYEEARLARSRPFRGSLDDAADELEQLVRESVRDRLAADVPVGAFLSGGVDSSTVVAIASTVQSPVHTFTIGFDNREFDESRHGEAVARHLGTNHRTQMVSERDAIALVPRLADIWDEPFADSSQIPTFLVAELARREVTVALSGDGGDELFGGYARYRYLDRLVKARRIAKLPGFGSLARVGLGAGGRVATALGRERVANRVDKLGRVFRSDESLLYRELVMQWPHPPVRSGARLDPLGRWCEMEGTAAAPAVDTVSYLPDDILVKVDRGTMAHSLEGRVPLLSESIFSHAWSLPEGYRWGSSGGKAVLKRVLDRHVPKHLFDRPKSGFGIPLGRWLRFDLRDWGSDLLDSREFDSGFFAVEKVRESWRAHLSGDADVAPQLWGVFMFETWRRRYHPDWQIR